MPYFVLRRSVIFRLSALTSTPWLALRGELAGSCERRLSFDLTTSFMLK